MTKEEIMAALLAHKPAEPPVQEINTPALALWAAITWTDDLSDDPEYKDLTVADLYQMHQDNVDINDMHGRPRHYNDNAADQLYKEYLAEKAKKEKE